MGEQGERAPQDQLFSASGRTALAARPPEEHPRRWLRPAAAIIIGVATIVGVFIALMETQGLEFLTLADLAESSTVRRRRTASQGAVLFHPSLR